MLGLKCVFHHRTIWEYSSRPVVLLRDSSCYMVLNWIRSAVSKYFDVHQKVIYWSVLSLISFTSNSTVPFTVKRLWDGNAFITYLHNSPVNINRSRHDQVKCLPGIHWCRKRNTHYARDQKFLILVSGFLRIHSVFFNRVSKIQG